MKAPLETLAEQVAVRRDIDSPPLHLWHPEFSGEIPIRINTQGTWYHDGSEIKRESLVRLFASILRREDDGEYYLVTPSEKWRVVVESHPLLVTDIEVLEVAGVRTLEATQYREENCGKRESSTVSGRSSGGYCCITSHLWFDSSIYAACVVQAGGFGRTWGWLPDPDVRRI
jgi:hypothetical protein